MPVPSPPAAIVATVLVLALCFGLLIYSMFAMGLRYLRHNQRQRSVGKASLTWPRAPGHIEASRYVLTSHLIETEAVIENDLHDADPSADEEQYYRPVVIYSYSIAGQSFSGKRIAFRDLIGSKRRARRIVERYPPGKSVLVSYDPHQPRVAVLEPGARGSVSTYGIPAISFGTAAILVGLAVAAIYDIAFGR